MPIGDRTMSALNCRFSPKNIADTAVTEADRFAPGQGLQLDWVIDDSRFVRKFVHDYFEQLPPAMKEAIRATLYAALTETPPTPVLFQWEARYDWVLQVRQTPNTKYTPGMINLIIGGRYAPDAHPMADEMVKTRQAGAGASKRAVTKAAKRGSRPAKRRPSRKS
ncbi:MAG: hypothetical protein GC206_06905 [Alphaproteobacteria bacterium]|nr:hypothetical protein [Alphaproteobacteria bacterium]